ncbi:uncharacterized protein Z520_04549 [Fonsecaea multimorphosa CBS 102226]|uniref:Uncharacterized protein n=1 Tax=Fonsecaea multimorphosa CBS 102226 TaxID=1442371 RepID=A0A0D2K264_9EURO|nr:uncharacterized protein Z520_04549 [Fonsecaea multimorphosa CBS 102226]KIX99912.1 hypothetical protein Z520_04549 [Fonsecaea multimorphosa CBS 102226]OAL26387.1 hypothetical protein AYO22_04305 [Fonsecaea multimorphosa]
MPNLKRAINHIIKSTVSRPLQYLVPAIDSRRTLNIDLWVSACGRGRLHICSFCASANASDVKAEPNSGTPILLANQHLSAMSESAVAETSYFHTLTARPYFFPLVESRDARLADVISRLTMLPAEIRWDVFAHAFRGNRVAVTAKSGCYCFSDATGPYRADHQWLLRSAPPGQVRREAQRVFIQMAMWELHCQRALQSFVNRMKTLHSLEYVRHVRLNVFEQLEATWELDLDTFPNLRTVTFAPNPKGWTITVPQRAGSEELSDANVMLKVWHVLESRDGYGPVREAYEQKASRAYRMFFVFPIRFHLPETSRDGSPRWQLSVWRANMDTGSIERDWREVHLVQEATLD